MTEVAKELQPLRDKLTAIKHQRDYHLMDEPDYIDEILRLLSLELEKQDIKSRIAELKKVRETAHHYYIDPEAFYKPPHLLIDDRINELNSLSQSPVNTDGEKR